MQKFFIVTSDPNNNDKYSNISFMSVDFKELLEKNEIVNFVKGYIDLFIESANMTKPLTQDTVFNLMQIYESTLSSHTHISDEIDLLVEILCNDVYGLACSLFLKNEGLDQETTEFFSKNENVNN